MLRKYRRQIKKNNFQFPTEAYNNIVGSLIITHYILNIMNGNEIDVNAIKSKWKYIVKKGLDFWIDDKDFIPKVLAIFGMKPIYNQFAMVQSPLNTLFLPYINGQIFPIREDGVYPNSAIHGKIYPIEDKQKEEINV